MEFPSLLTVKAISATDKLPIPRVAIVLELIAKIRNNYPVGPSITDGAGIVRFSRDDCHKSIKKSQAMFIMDYSGDLRDCAPRLVVRLLPPDNIAKMIKNFEQAPEFWGQSFDNPVELFAQLRTVRNAEFEVARMDVPEHRILADSEIVFTVSPTGFKCDIERWQGR